MFKGHLKLYWAIRHRHTVGLTDVFVAIFNNVTLTPSHMTSQSTLMTSLYIITGNGHIISAYGSATVIGCIAFNLE